MGSIFEIARGFALGGKVTCQPQRAGLAVDGEHGNRVVATIGGEEELAAGMHLDFGRVVAPENPWEGWRRVFSLCSLAAGWRRNESGDRGL